MQLNLFIVNSTFFFKECYKSLFDVDVEYVLKINFEFLCNILAKCIHSLDHSHWMSTPTCHWVAQSSEPEGQLLLFVLSCREFQ